MHKKFELNRTKIKGAISCQSEGGQVSLVFSVLYAYTLAKVLCKPGFDFPHFENIPVSQCPVMKWEFSKRVFSKQCLQRTLAIICLSVCLFVHKPATNHMICQRYVKNILEVIGE